MNKKVDIIRYRHDVIIHYHALPRGVVLQETVDVFGQIEDDDHQKQHGDGEKECTDVLLEDICVYLSHPVFFIDARLRDCVTRDS